MIIHLCRHIGMAQPCNPYTPNHQHQPQGPVNLRVRVNKTEHQALRRLSVDLDRPLGDLLHEGAELLCRYYKAQGAATAAANREDACDD